MVPCVPAAVPLTKTPRTTKPSRKLSSDTSNERVACMALSSPVFTTNSPILGYSQWGITTEAVRELRQAGANGVAVASGILEEVDRQ